MKLQSKIYLCFIVSFLFLITSGVVFADEAPAMNLVENGTVSGDAQIIASNPWKTSGNLEYTIPSNVEEIKSVNVVVSSYSGSGAPTYALYSNITLTTKNGLKILGYEDLFCDVSMTNDPTVYIINNHTTKQYSDYQSFYNITDSVKTLSPGDTIKISVENSKKEGYAFDARIKIIALTFAYDDGDNDEINYWLNLGQSWTQSSCSNLIKTKDFDGEYDEVIFEDIALSSYNAICKINGKLIYDPIYEKTGGYFIDDIWNITDNFIVGQDTNFTYKASSSGYGSFKSNVQLLKIIKNYLNVKTTITPQYKDTIFAGVSNNLTMNVYSNHDINAVVKLYNNKNLVYSENVNLIGGIGKKLYYLDPEIRPVTSDTVNGANNKHENYTLVLEDNNGNILNSTDVSYSVLYNGNLGKDFAYPASNATVNRFYNITGDIIILTQGDSNYMGSSETHHESCFNVDSIDINEGLLYVAYNWDKIASNDFNSWNITFNNQTIIPIVNYRDQSNLGTYGKYGYGLVVYNVTGLVKAGDNKLVLDKNANECAVYPSTLVLLTNNNESRTYKLVCIAENADLLSKQANLATGFYTFMDVEFNNFINSTLYVFAAGGESGEGNIIVNKNLFNNVWNKTKNSIDYCAIDMNLFILNSNNIYFQATGSTILALQDILVIEIEKITPELNVKSESILVGENLTIEVTLPEDATGDVSIDDMVVSLVNGKASFIISDLAVGNYIFTVKYSGDDKYNPTSNKTSVNVADPVKVTPVLYINAKDTILVGENLTIDVTLPEDATGDVCIGIVYIPLKNGKASFTTSTLDVGSHTFTVKYSGDEKYNPTNNKTTVTVKDKKSIIISAPDVTKYYGGSERFVVTVTDNNAKPLAGKSVTVVINGVHYDRTTNANGTTSIPLGLASNTYSVTVTVDNQTVNSVAKILPTVNGTDIVKVFRNGTQYYATFLDTNGKCLADGTVVQFNINGIMYDRKVSGGKGLAKLNINLNQGEYIITAENPETGEKSSNKITVLSRLVENKDLTKYYRNNSQYVVRAIGDNGKPVGAGKVVVFNINGVMYERTTNASGHAKLNINLAPGDYIITAEYEGCKVSNNIKVLSILSASDLVMSYKDGSSFKATLVDGKGKPLANAKVQFNVNGVFYTRTTNSSGVAKLTINLMAGKYIITSSYNGCNIANTILIKG